jgi:DNA-binding transcriptional LysR family regulator
MPSADTVERAMRGVHTPAITIDRLRAFVAVAELGSFSGAAAHLGIAQSTISRATAALEETVGARLFNRSPRGASMTSEGFAVLRDARQALALVDGLPLAAAGVAVQGLVCIGAFRSATEHLLPPVLDSIRTQHPAVTIRVETVPERAGGVARAVAEGRIDVGITSLPIEKRGLVTTHLFDDPYVRVEPVSYVTRDLPYVLWDEDCSRKAVAWLNRRAIPIRTTLELDDDRAVLAHVAQGLGYSIMPRLSTLGARHVRRRTLEDGPVRQLGACTSAAALRRPEVAEVYDAIKRHFLVSRPTTARPSSNAR